MSLIEHELAKLTTARLRVLAQSEHRVVATAAQAELNDRPTSPVEELRATVFPPHPAR